MMGEETIPGTVLNFDDFIAEMGGYSRSEFDANRHFGASNTANPDQRRQQVQNAAWKHVVAGDHKKAHAAAYEVAKSHALADRHSEEAAHEIATRRAKTAVKTAIELHTKKR